MCVLRALARRMLRSNTSPSRKVTLPLSRQLNSSIGDWLQNSIQQPGEEGGFCCDAPDSSLFKRIFDFCKQMKSPQSYYFQDIYLFSYFVAALVHLFAQTLQRGVLHWGDDYAKRDIASLLINCIMSLSKRFLRA